MNQSEGVLRGVFGAVAAFRPESSWGAGFGGAWYTSLAQETAVDGARICVSDAVMRWEGWPRRRRGAGGGLMFKVRVQAWRIAWGQRHQEPALTGTLRNSGGYPGVHLGVGRPSGAAERPTLTPSGPLTARRRCQTAVEGSECRDRRRDGAQLPLLP